jgi:hypothetical protein
MHGPEAVSDKHEKKYRMTEYRRETRKEFAVGWKSTRNNASNSPLELNYSMQPTIIQPILP